MVAILTRLAAPGGITGRTPLERFATGTAADDFTGAGKDALPGRLHDHRASRSAKVKL